MAKRAKRLEIKGRNIYKPEPMECGECGTTLELQRHYQWRKTVQHLSGAVYVASQGGKCSNPECSRKDEIVTSEEAQRLTLPECTYGLDVIAQIGWWRDKEHMDRAPIHSRLTDMGVQLSERQVDYLYNRYQILLACVGNQERSRLQEIIDKRGGLQVSLDGLAPEGASEQLWVVREVESQITLVVAWLDKVDSETLQTLLKPVEELDMPILATLSDKQPCVKKALEELWPDVPHQWCQPHYLSNIADPLYEQDRKLKTQMCQEIRAEVRASLAEVLDDDDDSAVHFVAGVAVTTPPSSDKTDTEEEPPDEEPPMSGLGTQPSRVDGAMPETESESIASQSKCKTTTLPTEPTKTIQQIVRKFALDFKECLSRKGRAPFIFAGLPMVDDLIALRNTFLACLALHEETHLRLWTTVLTRIIDHYNDDFDAIKQASSWVDNISHILAVPNLLVLADSSMSRTISSKSDCVQQLLHSYLDALAQRQDLPSWLALFRSKLIAITKRYWSGLFHCYDIEGLPRSNNDLESLFGLGKRLIRRRLGVQQLREALRRHAPWALILTNASSVEELISLFQQVSLDDYLAQRSLFDARLQHLLHRFQWRHQRDKLLQQRLHEWTAVAAFA